VIVRTAITTLPPAIAARVQTDLWSERPLVGHPGELVRALQELIDNALRLSPKELPITVLTRDEPDGTVHLSVQDSGPGVPGRERDRVFLPFYTTRHDVPGAGLGLSVARGVARRHGGSLVVESAEGEGATFTLRLPALPAAVVTEPAFAALPGAL
jgi:signal transduction histidine kinase